MRHLELLFPVPIYVINLNLTLSEEELKFISQQKRIDNVGNQTTEEKYLLENKEMARVKDRLTECCNEYAGEVWKVQNPSMFITQSWANWTKPNHHHHQHTHKNSLYSGVFYLSADDEKDRICFFAPLQSELMPVYKEWTKWNSDMWWVPIKTGEVVLFPSWLKHGVDTVEEGNREERISLAFNVFAKKLGAYELSTELDMEWRRD